MYVYLYTDVYTSYIHIYIYTHVYIYIYTYVYIYGYIYIYTCIHIYIYMRIYIYMYITSVRASLSAQMPVWDSCLCARCMYIYVYIICTSICICVFMYITVLRPLTYSYLRKLIYFVVFCVCACESVRHALYKDRIMYVYM